MNFAKQTLTEMHIAFLANRAPFVNMWAVRESTHLHRDERDSFPIELRPSHRAKWTKVKNQVFTGNDGISYYDEKPIDAGWNYVSVVKDSALNTPSERSALNTPSERSALNTPSERSALNTPSERSALNTPSERSALNTPLEKPVLRRHIYSFENEHYKALDEILEKQSAKEEEPDNLERDWKTFGMCVSWHLETIDEILERRSAKEEELDDDVKNRQTFENPIAWEHYPFEAIV